MVYFRSGTPKKQLRGQVAWFFFWLLVTAFGVYLHPSSSLHGTHQRLGLPACPSVAYFDRPCFGCGLTTSFTATIHGDFATAFKAHPFGPLMYLLFTASALACLYGWVKGMYFDTNDRRLTRLGTAFVIVFAAYGIFRFATTTYGSPEYKIMRSYSLVRSK